MRLKPAIVLVPGACHFPACFDIFVKKLQAGCYETHTVAHASVYKDRNNAPQITGHQDDAQAIRSIVLPLIQDAKEVIVFAHSYGGRPTTEALAGLGKTRDGNRLGGVIHIVYCAAFVGDIGISQVEQNAANPDGSDGFWIHIQPDFSMFWFKREHAIDVLYQDVPRELAEKAVDQLGFQAGVTLATPLEKCAWKDIPSTYILCEEDKAVFPIFQERMARNAGIRDIVRLSACSHSPFLSRPGELVQIIDRIVRKESS